MINSQVAYTLVKRNIKTREVNATSMAKKNIYVKGTKYGIKKL